MGRRTHSDRELAHATRFIIRAIDENFDGNQSIAARAFGCDPSTLNKIKSGKRKPITIVSGVADALGVSVDEVLGRKSSGRTVATVEQGEPQGQFVELTPRYHFRDEAKQALLDDGIAERDAERAISAVVAFDEGSEGSSALHLYRLAKHLLAVAKGKAVGVRELEE